MIVKLWHSWVKQPKESLDWHKEDVADEYAELQEARGVIGKWSELSDVVYTVTRARWSGHKLDYPIAKHQIAAGYLYMFPKYSFRTLFFRRAGKKASCGHTLQSVRNPRKIHKLHTIAEQNNIDKLEFEKICRKQLKYWPLLP